MNRSQSYSVERPQEQRPKRITLNKAYSYATTITKSPDELQFLPATTYVPPSPRGRLVAQQYIRPSLRLDHHMMPSPEEIINATRGRRSSSVTSTSSMSSTSSTRSEKRQGRIYMPTNSGLLDLLENAEAHFSD